MVGCQCKQACIAFEVNFSSVIQGTRLLLIGSISNLRCVKMDNKNCMLHHAIKNECFLGTLCMTNAYTQFVILIHTKHGHTSIHLDTEHEQQAMYQPGTYTILYMSAGLVLGHPYLEEVLSCTSLLSHNHILTTRPQVTLKDARVCHFFVFAKPQFQNLCSSMCICSCISVADIYRCLCNT